jgi:hypothetical protein
MVEGDSTAGFELSDGAETGTIWKQPSKGGVGGNPFIYLDPDGDGPQLPQYIGRCVQDGKIGNFNHGKFSVDKEALATSVFSAQAIECSNKGSHISISSDTSADGGQGHLLLTNQYKGEESVLTNKDIAASWAFGLGGPLQVRKGGGVNGVGGNPYIAVSYGSGEGDALEAAHVASFTAFGKRCNKL